MGDTKGNLLSGLKSFFVEEEETTSQPTKTVSPATEFVAKRATDPSNSLAVNAKSVTQDEVKAAEATVSNWTGFKDCANLKKFAAIEAKLSGKITDPLALKAAAFDMAEVAGIDKKAIIDEAKAAVSKLHIKLSESETGLKATLSNMDLTEKSERNKLTNQIQSLQEQLARAQNDLDGLGAIIAQAKEEKQKSFELTQQIAVMFIEQWSSITESTKS